MRDTRVLVICRFFAPQQTMGAIRPTKIAKYLTRAGGRVTAVCGAGPFAQEDALLKRDSADVQATLPVRDAFWVRALATLLRQTSARPAGTTWAYPVKGQGIMQWARWNLQVLLEWAKERSFARRAVRTIRRENCRYDAIYSSYGPLGGHYAAYTLKKSHPETVWVADFRDAPYSEDNLYRLARWRAARLSRQVFRLADHITVTTPGIVKDMGWTADVRVQWLSNGYDLEDWQDIVPAVLPQGPLHLVYTGAFYGEKRTLAPLFAALRELTAGGCLPEERFCLHYAGADFASLAATAETYGLGTVLKDHGLLERCEALALQKAADVLVLSSWSSRAGSTDVIPGKLYEYMPARKPLLAVLSGDRGDSSVARIIREEKLGFCYEEAHKDMDFPAMKAFLMQVNGATMPQRLPERFNYWEIARRLEILLEKKG